MVKKINRVNADERSWKYLRISTDKMPQQARIDQRNVIIQGTISQIQGTDYLFTADKLDRMTQTADIQGQYIKSPVSRSKSRTRTGQMCSDGWLH